MTLNFKSGIINVSLRRFIDNHKEILSVALLSPACLHNYFPILSSLAENKYIYHISLYEKDIINIHLYHL